MYPGAVAIAVSIASAMIALIGLLAGYYYFRTQNRRNKLIISSTFQPLIAASADSKLANSFEVTYEGKTVARPHMAIVTISNPGPKDIQSDHFDQSRPISISLDATVVAAGPSESSPVALKNEIAGDSIRIGPDLITKGSFHALSMIVDGTPDLRLTEAPLVNCDVAVNPVRTGGLATAARASSLVSAAALALAVIVAVWNIAAPNASNSEAQTPSPRTKAEQNRIEWVIQRAESQLGVTYAWGGGDKDGPTLGIRDGGVADSFGDYNKIGFDDSGLIIYAFSIIGYELPHYSGYQYNAGERAPIEERERGDLLFWGQNGSQHVAIYLGNDSMIECPQSGKTVSKSPVRFDGIVPYVVRLR